MNHDIDIKKVRVNCFRQSKVAGEFMLQLRVPGNLIDAKYLAVIQEICQRWGNGTFHIGTRQTLNAPGIKYEYIDEVNKFIKDYIKEVEIDMCDVDMNVTDAGYPTIGARNVMACIGNSHCIKGNDRSGAEKIIDSVLTDQLIQCDMPMYMVRCLTFDLIGTFMKAASELLDSTGETDLEKVVPVVQILNFQTLDQLRASLLEVFDRIAEALQARHPNRSDTVVEQCLAYIQQNYTDNNLNIAAVAQAMEMNPNYLSRIFKEKQGCGILDYLNQLRVEKAKELLRSTTMKTAEIAYAVGYKDPHYFSYLFKKTQECTPREFRAGV